MTRWWILVGLVGLVGSFAPTAHAGEMLTNEAIVTMVKAGLSEDLLIMKITSSPNTFDISTNNLLSLKQQGVGDAILRAMLQSEGQTQGAKKDTAKEAPVAPAPPQFTWTSKDRPVHVARARGLGRHGQHLRRVR